MVRKRLAKSLRKHEDGMPAGKQLLGSGLLKVLFKKARQDKESSSLISQLRGNAKILS